MQSIWQEDTEPTLEEYFYYYPELSVKEALADLNLWLKNRADVHNKAVEEMLIQSRIRKNRPKSKYDPTIYVKIQRIPLNPKVFNNPITGYWDPTNINLRQIEWAMERKRRIYREGKIPLYIFRQEIKQLSILRKDIIQKRRVYHCNI